MKQDFIRFEPKKAAEKANKAEEMLLMAKYGYGGLNLDSMEEEIEAAEKAEKAKPMKLKKIQSKPKPKLVKPKPKLQTKPVKAKQKKLSDFFKPKK